MLGSPSDDIDKTIENRLYSLNSSIDVRYNSEVKRLIKRYTGSQARTCEALLGRSSIYFQTFENILREKGLPLDIKYLSVIESGLRPTATSGSGAAGLWQFMRPTGRMMGLKISRTIDERRDVEKSTAAAADYLLLLYNRFDDWTLAIAAYNCGPGNLRKAIRKSGGKKTFWEIEKYLPRETRKYVPKFIAISYVMNYYYAHDLVPDIPNELLINTSTAKVYESLNLISLSKELNIDFKVMKTLNPSYIRNYIPKSEFGIYQLVLPTAEMRIVAKRYHVLASLPRISKPKVIVKQESRSIIEVINIPKIDILQSKNGKNNYQLKSMYLRPPIHRKNNRNREAFIYDPYKIDKRIKYISDFYSIVKISKRAY